MAEATLGTKGRLPVTIARLEAPLKLARNNHKVRANPSMMPASAAVSLICGEWSQS